MYVFCVPQGIHLLSFALLHVARKNLKSPLHFDGTVIRRQVAREAAQARDHTEVCEMCARRGNLESSSKRASHVSDVAI